MGKDPSMPLYVNDWLSSPRIQAMSQEQELAYFRLLCFCWASQDASIVDDDEQLAALSRMGEGWLMGGCQLVRACFVSHPTKLGHLTNARLYELWQERQEWKAKSAAGGRKSAQARKKRRAKDGSTTLSTKRQPNGNSSSSSSSSSIKKTTSSLFDQFWIEYPKRNGRKVGKQQAAESFAKLSETDRTLAVRAAKHYATSQQVGEGYAKDAFRFLRSDFWRDWLTPETATNRKASNDKRREVGQTGSGGSLRPAGPTS